MADLDVESRPKKAFFSAMMTAALILVGVPLASCNQDDHGSATESAASRSNETRQTPPDDEVHYCVVHAGTTVRLPGSEMRSVKTPMEFTAILADKRSYSNSSYELRVTNLQFKKSAVPDALKGVEEVYVQDGDLKDCGTTTLGDQDREKKLICRIPANTRVRLSGAQMTRIVTSSESSVIAHAPLKANGPENEVSVWLLSPPSLKGVNEIYVTAAKLVGCTPK